ncbi:MAG: hypothetical protein ACYC6F_17605 [Longimicrobiales bacterium]
MDTTVIDPAWVVAFRDGVVVGDGNGPRVTAFDGDGRVRWIYAPPTGDGPGEMRFAVDAIESDDGLWVLAWPTRLMLLSDDGKFLRQLRITPDPIGLVGQIDVWSDDEAVLLIGTSLARVSLSDGHITREPVPIPWVETPPGDWIADVRMVADGTVIAVGMAYGPEVVILENDSMRGAIFREGIPYRVRGRRVDLPGGAYVMEEPSGIIPFGATRLCLVDSELWVLTGGAYLHDRVGIEEPHLNDQLLVYSLAGSSIGTRSLPFDTRGLAVAQDRVYLLGVENEKDALPTLLALARR